MLAALWDREMRTRGIAGTSVDPLSQEEAMGAEEEWVLRAMLRQIVRHTLTNNGQASMAGLLYPQSSAIDEEIISKSDDARQLFNVVKVITEEQNAELQQLLAEKKSSWCNEKDIVDFFSELLRVLFDKPTPGKIVIAFGLTGHIALNSEHRGIVFVKRAVLALEDEITEFLRERYGLTQNQETLKSNNDEISTDPNKETTTRLNQTAKTGAQFVGFEARPVVIATWVLPVLKRTQGLRIFSGPGLYTRLFGLTERSWRH
eukprot:scpid81971/ scgid29023/ 